MDQDRMRKCLVRELKSSLLISGIGCVPSVFFGGGTPSLMEPSTIKAILDEMPGRNEEAIEVSLEANPGDLLDKGDKLQTFLEAGVNRISLGIQALSDRDLVLLNRDHDLETGFRALEISLRLLPEETSVDLIFGRPGQTLENGRKSWADCSGCFASITSHSTSSPSSEVPNFSRTSKTASYLCPTKTKWPTCTKRPLKSSSLTEFRGTKSQTLREKAGNAVTTNYWRGGEYIGVGPGAHSRFLARNLKKPALNRVASKPHQDQRLPGFRRQARIQTLEPDAWMREVEREGHGTRSLRELTSVEVAIELLGSSLRTREGLSNEIWSEHCD